MFRALAYIRRRTLHHRLHDHGASNPRPFPLVSAGPSVTTARVNSAHRVRLGVLGSGKGSNFVAIADACAAGSLPAEVALVLSDVPGAGILDRARERGLRARYLAPGPYRSKLDPSAEAAYVQALQEARADWVVLAGFMRIVKEPLLRAFPQRIVNIHPALLPSFPGLESWKQALEYGVKVTGVTVHLVDAGIDSGPIVAQAPVAVEDDDTPATLHARIQQVEHELYPAALTRLFTSRLEVVGRRARLRTPHSPACGQTG